MSKEMKTVIREGMAAVQHREFMILDSPPGAGATTAMEALKQVARADANTVLIELTANEGISTAALWRVLLHGLGEKPAWCWSERDQQLQRRLYELANQGKRVLIIMDDAVIMPPRHWYQLMRMASMHYEGLRYGPAIMLSADLSCSTMRRKFSRRVSLDGDPRSQQTLGDILASTDILPLQGLHPDEIMRYITYQATRDGIRFHPNFIAEMKAELDNSYYTANGLDTRPGVINQVGKTVMRERHRLGEPITSRAKPREKVEAPV